MFAQTITEEWKSYIATNDVSAVAQEDNFLWLGGTAGVTRLNMDTKEIINFNINTDSTLTIKNVTSACIDKKGNKWFGTLGSGIYKYGKDGKWEHFTYDSKTQGSVVKMDVDSQGNVWIVMEMLLFQYNSASSTMSQMSSQKGVVGFAIDKSDNIFYSVYPEGLYKINSNGFYSSFIGVPNSYTPSRNNIFIDGFNNILMNVQSSLRNSYIAKYNEGNGWEVYSGAKRTVYQDIYSLTKKSNGESYVIVGDSLYKYDGNKFNSISIPTEIIEFNKYDKVFADNKNNIWLGSSNYGLFKLNDGKWEYYPTSKGIFTNDIREIAFDKKGNKWMATNMGVMRFDGTNWKIYNKNNSNLPVNNILSVAVDSKDNIWAATGQYNIAKFDGKDWTTITIERRKIPNDCGFSTSDKVFVDKDDNLWVSTYVGSIKIDVNDVWTCYNNTNSGLFSGGINDFAQRDGDMWVSTRDGIAKFDGNSWKAFHTRYIGNYFLTDIEVDKDESPWVRSDDDLEKFSESKSTLYTRSRENFYNLYATSIAIDKQNIKWIGTTSYGLLKYNDASWSIITQENSPILSNNIRKIFVEYTVNGKVLWILTDIGLCVYSQVNSNVTDIEIISNPVSYTVDMGGEATFSVKTKNTHTYQWQFFENSKWKNISEARLLQTSINNGSNFSNLTIKQIPEIAAGYVFRCKVSNGFIEKYSNEAKLNVNVLKILEDVKNQEIYEGSDVTFNVTIQNGAYFLWEYYDGKSWKYVKSNELFQVKSLSELTSSLTLTGVSRKANNFKFRCMASNATYRAWVYSLLATLNVKIDLTITNQLSNKEIFENESVNYDIVAKSQKKISYQWQISRGATFENITSNEKEFVVKGEKTANLIMSNVKLSTNNSSIRCVVSTLSDTIITNLSKLTVKETFSILQSPKSSSIIEGSSAAFEVFTSKDSLTYSWQYLSSGNWVELPNTTNNFKVDGLGTNKIMIKEVNFLSNGLMIRCVVSNKYKYKQTSDEARLTVEKILGIDDPNEFSLYPNPVTQTYLHISNAQNIKNYSLVNSQGIEIFNKDLNSDILNIGSQANGVYFIKLFDKKGNTYTKKILITQ